MKTPISGRGAPLSRAMLLCVMALAVAAPSGDTRLTEAVLERIRANIAAGRYAEAERAGRDLLPRVESSRGADSREIADVLDLLVEALWRGGKEGQEESRSLAERAVRIRRGSGAPDDPALAASLDNLGLLLAVAGRLDESEPILREALEITERRFGPVHADVARSLNSLAYVHRSRGDYERAAALYERALAIREKAPGVTPAELSSSCHQLSLVRWATGDGPAAIELLQRALSIQERELGRDHMDVATTLNTIAVLLTDLGDYPEARRSYMRALRIREKVEGPHGTSVLGSLNDLAYHFVHTGDYPRARRLFEQALAEAERVLPPDSPALATYANNLAAVLTSQGELDRADRLLRRALEIREKAFGPRGILVASTLHEMAVLRREQGRSSEAIALLERSVQVHGGESAANKIQGGQAAADLAVLLAESGDLLRARRLVEAAGRLWRGSVGEDHPLVGRALRDAALIDLLQGDAIAALHGSLRASDIIRGRLREASRSLSESEALRHEAVMISGFDVALSALAERSEIPGGVERVWDSIVRSRALVLDEMAARHRAALELGGAEGRTLLRELQAARNRLARLIFEPASASDPAPHVSAVEAAREEKERAERALGELSLAFRHGLGREKTGLSEVRASLQDLTALVAFVEFNKIVRTGGAGAAGAAAAQGAAPSFHTVPCYAAFVLDGAAARPVVVLLGESERIDALVQAWRVEVSAAPDGPEAEGDCRRAGAALRSAIWDPVARHVPAGRRVLLVPDGALHLVNLAALPGSRGKYLIEEGLTFHNLSAERDAVRVPDDSPRGSGLLLVGGPDFDHVAAGSGAAETMGGNLRGSALDQGGPGKGADCEGVAGLRFAALPNAEMEVREIETLWRSGGGAVRGESVVRLSGPRATEAALREVVRGRRILHLATHGFFASGDCEATRPRGRRAGPGRLPFLPAALSGESPLLLSGLALAGANRRGEGTGLAEEDDGILTAEEIASFDLRGVEWVVLSACGTGLGPVHSGEGVLGLRRALETSGARSLLISLWTVEDQATRQWMRRLYEARFAGRSTVEAVRAASLGALEARRRAGVTTHPFYWGAFVAAGDWR